MGLVRITVAPAPRGPEQARTLMGAPVSAKGDRTRPQPEADMDTTTIWDGGRGEHETSTARLNLEGGAALE